MATITLNVNDEINKEFRNIVKLKFGEGKEWIFEQKQKEITERQIKTMKQGVWSLKNYKFNRGEIYEKRGNISC